LLNKNVFFHEWAKTQFANLVPPLLTCEAVLSEACYLLRNFERGAIKVLTLLEREMIVLPLQLKDEISVIKILLNKYKNIPMSFAAGCLVRMAEQISDSAIFTLDGDFKIYRKDRRKVIPTIMPDKN
jgi:uncharacterized protein